jgi:hypothetical protein
VKKLWFFLCFVLILSAGGCSKKFGELLGQIQSAADSASGDDYGFEVTAVKYEKPVSYHNSYLGFSYTVPRGWWLYDLNAENFSEDPEETADPTGLDIIYQDDGEYIDLISFANLQFSRLDNHLGFDIRAETVDGIDILADYMEYFSDFMLEPTETATYEFIDSSRVNIGVDAYEQRIFGVKNNDGAEYNLLTLTRPVNEGYFLTIMVSYWPSKKNAEAAIIDAVLKGL